MKNLLLSFLFIGTVRTAYCQIPTAGNLLWLRADRGIFKTNNGTPAILGDLVQVWEDQSGNGNHFVQNVSSYRPQWIAIANTLCSQPLMRFDVSRRTFLQSAFTLPGSKTIFIVFLQPGLSGNPQTLFSLKGNTNSYTEILCSDHPAYKPLSYMAEMPGSASGGTTMNSVGNNISFSPAGNIFTMTYDGGVASSAASYSSNYNAASTPVLASGLFGRLLHDTTTIGGRAPEQNYSFLTGYIGEIIVYNRVLTAAEISQVEAYLQGKFGFLGSCSVLPAGSDGFTAALKNRSVELRWNRTDETGIREYVAEHSMDQHNWDSVGIHWPPLRHYQLTDTRPRYGTNYYRLRIRYADGTTRYSSVVPINFNVGAPERWMLTPNPAADHIYIQNEKNSHMHFTIFNADGRSIRSINAYSNTAVDIHDLAPGIYFVSMDGQTQKFLKQ